MSSLCQNPELFIRILYQNIIFNDSDTYFLEMSMLIILVGTLTQLRMGMGCFTFPGMGPRRGQYVLHMSKSRIMSMPGGHRLGYQFLIIAYLFTLEIADLLAFRFCCFTLCRLYFLCSFSVWCLGKEVEFNCIAS